MPGWQDAGHRCHEQRAGHTATLLNDGRALVAGGFEGINALLSTAELFDPATGKFTLASGPMNASRAHHAAALLSSGKVLLAGGSIDPLRGDIFDPMSGARALLFDANAASFSATGFMSSSRAHHTATLLSGGKVLVAGGANIVTAEGGCSPPHTQSTSLAGAELFDPTNAIFAVTSSMTTARSAHTAALLANGDVLVIGGVDTKNNPLASAECIDSADWIPSRRSAGDCHQTAGRRYEPARIGKGVERICGSATEKQRASATFHGKRAWYWGSDL